MALTKEKLIEIIESGALDEYLVAGAAVDHVHGNITSDGKIGTAATKPIITGTGGALQAGAFGTTSGSFCEGNDARLSDERAPTAAAILAAHPIGSIYESTDSTSPATLFGGTWEAFGAGRVLVGLDAADSDFNTIGETGGEKAHALTAAENGQHYHGLHAKSGASALGAWGNVAYPSNSGTSATMNTGNSGTGAAHNNLQPYIVVYRWRRTA